MHITGGALHPDIFVDMEREPWSMNLQDRPIETFNDLLYTLFVIYLLIHTLLHYNTMLYWMRIVVHGQDGLWLISIKYMICVRNFHQ